MNRLLLERYKNQARVFFREIGYIANAHPEEVGLALFVLVLVLLVIST